MKELLKLEHVVAGYDSQVVLPDVTITIHENDFLGVIGPNGGGKTTFVKTLLGAIPPLKGEITPCVDSLNIGYLPQNSTIDKQFPISVIDTVLSGLMFNKGLLGRYARKDREKAEQMLAKIGISELSHRNIGELSGGELQRVLLSRALISEPQILVLDEPTTYVDNKFEKEMYALLKELNKSIAIVMISHDLGTISSHVKSIACVNRSFHYHNSNTITPHQLELYDCPIQLLGHGEVPHTILRRHS